MFRFAHNLPSDQEPTSAWRKIGKQLNQDATGESMVNNPFLFGAWRRFQRRPWALALLLVGPLLVLSPLALSGFIRRGVSQDDAAALGLQLLVTYLCIRGVSSTVGVISQERERARWDLLLSSGMRPAQIAGGFWTVAALPCLLEALLGAGMVFALQGTVALPMAWLLLGLVLFHVNWGLYCSLRFQSWSAAQWGYGWLGFLGVSGFAYWLSDILHFQIPGRSLISILNPWSLNHSMLDGGVSQAMLGACLYWALALGLVLALRRQLARATSATIQVRNLGERLPAQQDPLAYRNQSAGSPWRSLALLLLYLGLVLGPGLVKSNNNKDAMFLALVGHLGFWLVRALHTSLANLGREREQGTLASLMTTLLTPSELCRSFWRQNVRPVLLQALILSPLLLWVCGGRVGIWLYLVVLTLVSISGWAALGSAIALRSRSTLAAFQTGYLALAFVLVGTLTLDVLFVNDLTSYDGPLLSLVNPLVAALAVIENGGSQDWRPWTALLCLSSHLVACWVAQGYIQKRFAGLTR